MSRDASEQNNLPPSGRKIRELRRKGQVPSSKDMVGAFTLVVSSGYFLLASGTIFPAIWRVFDTADSRTSDIHFELGRVVGPIFALLLLTVLPIVGLVVSAALLTNVAVLRGVPFSTEPIRPDFSRLNPVAGFKRLFGLKAWVELGKSVCKTALLSAAVATVDDLAQAIRSGMITPSQVPVDYVVQPDGTKVILNTRTSAALDAAGIPMSRWYGVNRTGQSVTGSSGGLTYNDLVNAQIRGNKLPMSGTPSIPMVR